MMKRKSIILATAFTIFTLGASFIGSMAWFMNTVTLSSIDMKGDSKGAYFAYGNGTSGSPFGINTPRHLYNLAWLQYNGDFNKDSNSDGALDKQYYFEIDRNLTGSLDMTGWTLPPIGTETYPFLGSFNGNNKTIANLTVSNPSSFSQKPISINYNDQTHERPEIVGFFGVVGKISNTPSYTYTTSANAVTNVNLESITVKSETSQTLIGLAGGYVNGELSGVKVSGTSTIDVDGQVSTAKSSITSKLSDYGLVGYTTKEGSSGSYSQDLSEVYKIGGSGGGSGEHEGEGGSISVRDYIKWLYSGPRDNGASLTTGSYSAENHITKTNHYEMHYTASSVANINKQFVFAARSNDSNVFYFFDGTGVYYNGTNHSFSWTTHDSGRKPAGSTNYTITFDQNMTFGSRTNTVFYINHENTSSSNLFLFGNASHYASNNKLVSTTYNYICNIIYRVKDNYNSDSGDIHKSYVPLKFTDSSHSSVDDTNTGYIVGTSLVTTSGAASANGSPKMAYYGSNFISNSLGSTSYDSNVVTYQGGGNATYNDTQLEVITYSTADNDWVTIKDTHNTSYYGSATQPKNGNINSQVTKIRTPEQLGFKKYEAYASDPNIVDTPERPLTRNAFKNIMSYEEGGITKPNYQLGGLHFDTVTVTSTGQKYGSVANSASHKITIPKARLNGLDSSSSTNYELLSGAINFKFPSKGYVNFFAGTYNSTASVLCNFFSLYNVKRSQQNPNQISSIQEIVGVYKKKNGTSSDPYIYKVYNVDSNGSNTGSAYFLDTDLTENDLDLVFDVDKALRCTNNDNHAPVNNALYYFEVPINPGEYAMGAVSNTPANTQGAYMMYLDIGANAEATDAISAYHINTKTTSNDFPVGVDFDVAEASNSGGDSFGVFIDSGSKGTIVFNVSSNGSNVTVSSVESTSMVGAYAFRSDGYLTDFTITGLSGDPPNTSAGGVRILTIKTTLVSNGNTYTVRIHDYLDINGAISSSDYYLGIGSNAPTPSTLSTIQNTISILNNEKIAELRSLVKVVTLTRESGNSEFVTTYDIDNCSYTDKKIDVDIEINGCTISVGTITAGYSFYVDGVQKSVDDIIS